MKQNNNFFKFSSDAEYVTKEKICTITKGSATALEPGTTIFVSGSDAIGYAGAKGAHVHAVIIGAIAVANVPHSSAYALVRGAIAKAAAPNSTAYATCESAIIEQSHPEGIVVSYAEVQKAGQDRNLIPKSKAKDIIAKAGFVPIMKTV